MSTPTLLGLPAEIRVLILREVFRGTFFCPGHDEFCESSIHKDDNDLSCRNGVLAVNHSLRREALPLVADNLSLYLHQEREFPRLDPEEVQLPSFCHKVSILYLSNKSVSIPSLPGLERIFQNLKRVECFMGEEEDEDDVLFFADTLAEFVNIVKGRDDHETIIGIK